MMKYSPLKAIVIVLGAIPALGYLTSLIQLKDILRQKSWGDDDVIV
jgi:hypothetical protein